MHSDRYAAGNLNMVGVDIADIVGTIFAVEMYLDADRLENLVQEGVTVTGVDLRVEQRDSLPIAAGAA